MKRLLTETLAILTAAERKKFGFIALFHLFTAALDIAFLSGLLFIVNYCSGHQVAYSDIRPLLHTNNLWWLTGLFLLLFSIKNLLAYRASVYENTFFYNVASRLSHRNLSQYLNGHYTVFTATNSSVHIRRISQQPIEFSSYILTNIQQLFSQSVLILFAIIGILFYHPGTFLLLFIMLMPPVGALAYLIKQQLGNIRMNIKTSGQKAIQHLQESLSGYVESNIYHKHDFFISRYDTQQQQLNNNIAMQQSLQSLPSRLIEIFAILGLFLLILMAGRGPFDIMNIGVFMAASYKIIPGIVKILNSTGQIRTYGFVVNDLHHCPAPSPVKKHRQQTPLRSLRLCGLGFSYQAGDNILSDIDLDMQEGDMVGLSGDSGRGKTTLLNLLLGFLEPQQGRIEINAQPCNAAARREYFNRIAYVKQQTFLLNGTILQNITLSNDKPDAGRLAQAIQVCGIDKMTGHHADGLQKTITEEGKNISGGQRQRIALARALYHDPDLLILDEPFSELDEEATYELLVKLRQLIKEENKMLLLITHHKSSLVFCNKVLCFDHIYEA